jgi:hypothetical protein
MKYAIGVALEAIGVVAIAYLFVVWTLTALAS